MSANLKGATAFNKLNWEDAEFPILCQTCLGDNPYIRMTRDRYGSECKTCNRPFTVFRWCPGARMRFKKTEVCQTCARLKNVCQTCLLDLEHGLPVQVRDQLLRVNSSDFPKSDVNREYYIQQIEREKEAGGALAATQPAGALARAMESSAAAPASHETLNRLARTTPYYKRNMPHICSFWVKGECKRGEECPYRHEKPTDPDDPLSEQNLKDRFFGVNDPVADKLMKRYQDMPKLRPPDDSTITSLYIGGVTPDITEKDLRDIFYQYGEISHVNLVPRQNCAFVQFCRRLDAERAADNSYNNLVLKGQKLIVRWSRGQERREDASLGAVNDVPGLPTLPPPPPELFGSYSFPYGQPVSPPPPPSASESASASASDASASASSVPAPAPSSEPRAPTDGPSSKKLRPEPSVPAAGPPGAAPPLPPPAGFPMPPHRHPHPHAPPGPGPAGAPPIRLPFAPAFFPPPPPPPLAPMPGARMPIFYPSQDPSRLGAVNKRDD